jgi:hypothetical protein
MSTIITPEQLQKNPRQAFRTKSFLRVVSGEKDIGVILNNEIASRLFESGILQQLQEELWESRDTVLKKNVAFSRSRKTSKSISFDVFRDKYGV